MDYNSAMKSHMGNIGRLSGSNLTNRYSYIVSQDELVNAYLQMRNELGYPLMIDSKNRRAIVYNKKGLENKIQQIINKSIIDNIDMLDNVIVADITNKLNSITQDINGNLSAKNSGRNSMMNLLGNSIVKGIMKGVGDVLEDMNS